jgi:LysR family transcriptional regulator, low CO2-responsive transcriptional regulator
LNVQSDAASQLSESRHWGFRTAAQATEYQFLRELVAARVGIACSPESSVRSDVSSGRLRVLDVDAPGLSFDIRLLTSPSRPRTSAMQSLTAFLRAQIIAGQEDNTAP